MESSNLPAPITLSYEDALDEFLALLDQYTELLLATFARGWVSARSTGVIHSETHIYFQAASDSLKYEQLTQNPRVLLSARNLQIEGTASDQGHPLEPANHSFAETYARRHPNAFAASTQLSTHRVIAVQPRRVTLWNYDANHRLFQDVIDLSSRRAWREFNPLGE